MKDKDFQLIISWINDLDEAQRNKLREALEDSTDFEKVVSIIESRDRERRLCVHCQSENVKHWGRATGMQRFRCFDCGRTFGPLTGTPLAKLRKRGRWLTMIKALHDGLSVRATAKACGVAVPTAFRWRHRFLKALAQDRSLACDEVTEADQTYFRRSYKGSSQCPRPPRRRGGKVKGAGLPKKEFVAVLAARDRRGATVECILDRDRSARAVKKGLSGSLGPNTVLCIDGDNALWGFAQQSEIPCRVIAPGRHVHERDPVFHLQNVNAYHHRLKAWMRRFQGVATKYLSHYLGWFRIKDSRHFVQSTASWLMGCAGKGILQHKM